MLRIICQQFEHAKKVDFQEHMFIHWSFNVERNTAVWLERFVSFLVKCMQHMIANTWNGAQCFDAKKIPLTVSCVEFESTSFDYNRV